jgi:Kdo2-lipid IVA lauroyltransferase/acyltransferase
MLYALSDGIAYLLRNVLKYRLTVVRINVNAALTGLDKAAKAQIENKFYKTLSDNFIESIKGFSCSLEFLKKRYKVLNPEILKEEYNNGKSVLLAGSHYNNWEWGIQVFDSWFDHKICGIYQVVSNPWIHKYLMHKRSRYGMVLVSARNAIKNIQMLEGLHATMILNDQSPSNMERAIWYNFLGIDTPFVHGLEAIATKTNWPVYYYEVIRKKRGYYEIELSIISAEPAKAGFNEITATYASKLERTILKAPENWLWSHKRWKRIGI